MSSKPLASSSNLIRISVISGLAALVTIFGFTVASAEAAPAKSDVTIKPYGLKGGTAKIMSVVHVSGTVLPYKNGQRVRVNFYNNGRRVKSKSYEIKSTGSQAGSFRSKIRIDRGGKWAVQAKYYGLKGKFPITPSSTIRKDWRVRYTSIGKGSCGRLVAGFRKALNRLAMVPGDSKCFNGRMERAVLAYRKVNDFARNSRASKGIVKRVFNGVGGYRVRKPGLGDHMEAALSKQVIVFSRGKKPYAIFPTASGAPATPTILGTFSFYWKDPGYNELGMYYSSYFIRGYATHGYKSVPDYPASHGCLRTFIADQPRVYDLTEIGMPVYTFGDAFRAGGGARSGGFDATVPGGGLGPDLGPTGGLDPAAPVGSD